MAQTAQQIASGAREMARRMFGTATATINHDDLTAAVAALDAAMDALPPSLNQAKTVKQNLVAALPTAFAANSTTQQKALALMVWAMAETGMI